MPITEFTRKHIFSHPIYRVRLKQCVKCDEMFDTAEMPKTYIDQLSREIVRLKEVEKSSAEDKLQIETLTNKLKMIAEITNNNP